MRYAIGTRAEIESLVEVGDHENFALAQTEEEETPMVMSHKEQVEALCKMFGDESLADSFLRKNMTRGEVINRLLDLKEGIAKVTPRRYPVAKTEHAENFEEFANANSKKYFARRAGRKDGT
jgi:hypothetical protein